MKQSIKRKLMGLLSLAVIGLVVVGLMGTIGMTKINADRKHMQAIEQNVIQANQAVNLLLDLRIQLREALVNAPDPEARAASVQDIKDLNEDVYFYSITLKDTVEHPDSPAVLDELEELYAWLMVQEMNDFYNLGLAGNAEEMQIWLRAHVSYALHYQALCEQVAALEQEMADSISAQSDALAIALTIGSLVLLVGVCVAFLLRGIHLVNQIIHPLEKMAQASERLAAGDIDVDVTVDTDDELGTLSRAFQKMIHSESVQANVLRAVSEGDYTVPVEPRSPGDLMGQSIERLVQVGNDVMWEIGNTSSMVSAGAEQVAHVAQKLSDGSSEQRHNINAFSRLLQDVIDATNSHASKAGDSIDVAEKLCDMIEQSNNDMRAILAAMESIQYSTDKVSDIVKLIEDIAMQTNILSLNAAVEAARAGQHGKGFGVVADEVRSLAAKSAEAVSSISSLMQDSRSRVSEGNSIVEATNVRIEDMKAYIMASYELFQEIADSPLQRKSSMDAMEQGMEEVNRIVQDNFAAAQQAAATAEELSAQAITLNELTSRFKLNSEQGASATMARLMA